MHLTLEADYAVRIIRYLSRVKKRCDAKNISESTDVTLRFALKILRKLVQSGLVVSFKGTLGGYEIAKNPDDISLREVIEVVEGTYYFSRCLGEGNCCTRGENVQPCPVNKIYEDISKFVREQLDKVKISEIL